MTETIEQELDAYVMNDDSRTAVTKNIGVHLCEALGLNPSEVVKINIEATIKGATVTVELIANDKKLTTTLKNFKLIAD